MTVKTLIPHKKKRRTSWLLFILLLVGASVFIGQHLFAITHYSSAKELVLSASSYGDEAESNLWTQLVHRIKFQPFNLVAMILFFGAIMHTFFTHKFRHIAHKLEEKHRLRRENALNHGLRYEFDPSLESDRSFSAEIMHFLGEVEAVFFIWLIPVIIALTYFFDWHTAVEYVQGRDFTEPMFVVVIMTIAATRPIVNFAEKCLTVIARIGGLSPAAWWLTILSLGPLLGSFITEPAAMTLCCMLLIKQFYRYQPPSVLAYATIGLLFTNVSVGGTLTHFAAPPVLMVSKVWHWDTLMMLKDFGWKAFTGICLGNLLYFLIFRKQFHKITKIKEEAETQNSTAETRRPVPPWITIIHLILLAWTVAMGHYPPMFIGSFVLFLAFYQATAPHQSHLVLRAPVLVGCFLAGLVIHAGLQEWWISAVLDKVNESVLMFSAIVLTAFNDNAAITYLTTLVPDFSEAMKHAVVAGAVAGGGLTVIANAPNPAGYSLLHRYFKDGISPQGLFMAALTPTIIVSLCLAFL